TITKAKLSFNTQTCQSGSPCPHKCEDLFLRDAALLVVYLERPNFIPRANKLSRGHERNVTGPLRCCHVSSSSSSGPSPSMPSALILRVRVLRPQPSSRAASRRRP